MPPFDLAPIPKLLKAGGGVSAIAETRYPPASASGSGGDGFIALSKTSDHPVITRSNPRMAFKASCDGLSRVKLTERGVLASCAEIDCAPPPGGHKALFLTLTYKTDTWEPRHISNFVLRLGRWAETQGIEVPYVWVTELQKRGVVHYHVMIWIPASMDLLEVPKPDCEIIVVPARMRGLKARYTRPLDRPSQVIYSTTAKRIQYIKPMWPHGMSQRELAINPVAYMAKYTSKIDSKDGERGEFPKGCRLFGKGGLSERGEDRFRYAMAPGWVRKVVPLFADDPVLGPCEFAVRRASAPNSDRSDAKTVGGYLVFRRTSDYMQWQADRKQQAILQRKETITIRRLSEMMGRQPPPPPPKVLKPLDAPDSFFIPTPWRVLEFLKRSPEREFPELSVEWRGWTEEQMKQWAWVVQLRATALDLNNRTPDGPISHEPDKGWNWDEKETWPSRLTVGSMTLPRAQTLLSSLGLAVGAEVVEATGPFAWRPPLVADECVSLIFRIPAYVTANSSDSGPRYVYDLAG